jgi:methionine-rich copper-binding protein CopC
MKIHRVACALLLLGCSAVALAHTHLVKAIPADGSTLTASPAKFVLTFAEPVKMTALSLQKDAEAAKKIGPLPTAPAAEVSVPAPKLAAGKYVLSWRAVGDDGHVMPGKVRFTIGASGSVDAR